MSYDVPNFIPAIPELMVFSLGTLALLVQAFWGQKRPAITYGFVQITILLTGIVTLSYLI